MKDNLKYAIDNLKKAQYIMFNGQYVTTIGDAFHDTFNMIEHEIATYEHQEHYIERLKDCLNHFETKCNEYKQIIEIIKNKTVNCDALYYSKSLEEYNRNTVIDLTQEEYDLLRNMFDNEDSKSSDDSLIY